MKNAAQDINLRKKALDEVIEEERTRALQAGNFHDLGELLAQRLREFGGDAAPAPTATFDNV